MIYFNKPVHQLNLTGTPRLTLGFHNTQKTPGYPGVIERKNQFISFLCLRSNGNSYNSHIDRMTAQPAYIDQ